MGNIKNEKNIIVKSRKASVTVHWNYEDILSAIKRKRPR